MVFYQSAVDSTICSDRRGCCVVDKSAAVGFPPHPPSRFYVVVISEIRGATAPVSPAGSVVASLREVSTGHPQPAGDWVTKQGSIAARGAAATQRP